MRKDPLNHGRVVDRGDQLHPPGAVIDKGIQSDPKTALGYLELAAKVLDKTDENAGRVHFHLHTNVDIYASGKAREMHGLPPLARRTEGNGDKGVSP